MKVLIPHKDVIFLLTKIQQKFIFDFNNFSDFPTKNFKNIKARIIPLFPLWAFFDDYDFANFADSDEKSFAEKNENSAYKEKLSVEKKFNFKNLIKSQIEKIDFDFENNKFYFSIKLDFLCLETVADFKNLANIEELGDEFEDIVEKKIGADFEKLDAGEKTGAKEKKLQVKQSDFSKTLRIYFAQKLNAQSQNFSLEEFTKKFNADFFPIKMNVFKFANLSEKNSLYQVFDEKWIKISSK